MNTRLPPIGKQLIELCADSRTRMLLGGGMYLDLEPRDVLGADLSLSDPFFGEAFNRPSLPEITPLSFDPARLFSDSELITRFLGRMPSMALDLMVYVPPVGSLDPKPDAAELGKWADKLGIPVQIPTDQLAPLGDGGSLPDARDRFIPLNGDGRPTTLDDSSSVRVLPATSRSLEAWSDITAELAELMATRPYLSGRMVFGGDGVQPGLPAALVNQWYGAALSRFGRPLDEDDITAAGAGQIVEFDGYADLTRWVENLPPNTQALVAVDGATAGAAVYLVHRDPAGVSYLDPGRPGAVILPRNRSGIRLAVLPGSMGLDERLAQLNNARFAAEPPATWPMNWPSTVQRPLGDNPDSGIVVVGSARNEPPTFLAALQDAVGRINQPIIVLAAGHAGEIPDGVRVASVRTLLEQYGWRGKVPVVVTRGQLGDELPGILDAYGTSLVHRVSAPAEDASQGGLAVNFGPALSWTVRKPGGQAGPRLKAGSEPTLELLLDAAGEWRQPAFGRPLEDVATYLSRPLKSYLTEKSPVDLLQAPTVKTARPLVEQIAERDPSFAGHSAALRLAELGHADSVVSYLKADDKGRADAIFQPLMHAKGKTAAPHEKEAHEQTVTTLLPHLSSLAGGDLNDFASKAILTAIAGMIEGSMETDKVQRDIWLYKDYLPKDGDLRVEWVRRIGELKEQLPEGHGEGLDQIAEIIMTCPE